MPCPRRQGGRRAVDGDPSPAYDKNMKHVPEAHQHVAPDLTISLILAGVVAVMIVVYVVVALAK